MPDVLTTIPVEKIQPGENARTVFDEDAMRELVASVRTHGVFTPIVVTQLDDGYTLVAGARRLRAAKEAGLDVIPANVRDVDGQAAVIGVSENVIRSDLTALEEARAYQALADAYGGIELVAALTGRSEATIRGRLQILSLPDELQEKAGTRELPISVAPVLAAAAEKDAALAIAMATIAAVDPGLMASLADAPGDVCQQALAGQPADAPLAAWTCNALFSAVYGVVIPRSVNRSGEYFEAFAAAKLGDPLLPVLDLIHQLPAYPKSDGYNWQLSEAIRERLYRIWAMEEEDVDAARAYGCLLELAQTDAWGDDDTPPLQVITDPSFVCDRLRIHVEEVAKTAAKDVAKFTGAKGTKAAKATAAAGGDEDAAAAERKARADARAAEYQERVAARRRNLALGAAVAGWDPELNLAEAQLLAHLLLEAHAESAVWAQRLCIEQPTEKTRGGKEKVTYPRDVAEKAKLVKRAHDQVTRAKQPNEALAVVLRLLVVQHYVDTTGLPGADAQGVYEPFQLQSGTGKVGDAPDLAKLLDGIGVKVAPAAVKKAKTARRKARG